MTVTELNPEQLSELKEAYFQQLLDTSGDEVLGNITHYSQIPDEIIFAHYEGTYFVNDDFFCSMDT